MAPLRNALGTQLQAAYRSAAARLREDGVQPVGYAVAGHAAGRGAAGRWQGPVTGWSGMAGTPLPPSQPAVLAPDAEEALLTVAMLRQMLAQPMGLAAPVAAFPGGGLAAAAAEAMEDIAELERIVGRLSGSLPAPLAADAPAAAHPDMAAAAIAQPAAGPADAPARPRSRTASEVVSRMMDNIAQDDRLLPPVQRSLQNLRPALQRLVRHDPRFSPTTGIPRAACWTRSPSGRCPSIPRTCRISAASRASWSGPWTA